MQHIPAGRWIMNSCFVQKDFGSYHDTPLIIGQTCERACPKYSKNMSFTTCHLIIICHPHQEIVFDVAAPKKLHKIHINKTDTVLSRKQNSDNDCAPTGIIYHPHQTPRFPHASLQFDFWQRQGPRLLRLSSVGKGSVQSKVMLKYSKHE